MNNEQQNSSDQKAIRPNGVPPKIDTALIYPTPTKPELYPVMQQPSASQDESLAEKKEKKYHGGVLGVIVAIIGVIYIFLPWLSIAPLMNSSPPGVDTDFIQVIAVNPWIPMVVFFNTVVGVGIIFRKELARLSLVVLSFVSMVLILWNVGPSVQSVFATSRHSIAQISPKLTEDAATRWQADQQSSISSRQMDLQFQEKGATDTTADVQQKLSYEELRRQARVALIMHMIQAAAHCFLIVFFTRPAIKKLFH